MSLLDALAGSGGVCSFSSKHLAEAFLHSTRNDFPSRKQLLSPDEELLIPIKCVLYLRH